MAQLIDKSALVAEIERKRQELRPTNTHQMIVDEKMDRDVLMWLNALAWVKKLLNTLEVKDVDLEKELENLIEKEKAFVTDNREVKYYNGDSFNHIYELEFIAKHFFELGISVSNKVQKGEEI